MAVADLDAKTQVALALAQGATSDKAGETAGVSGRTVRRWREDPDFEAQVQEARRAILAEAVAALGSAAREAVDTLRAALSEESPSIRVRAAVAIISALPSLSEHVDLEARIASLEAAITEQRSVA